VRRHLEKSKNHDISATVRPIATKFGMVTQFNTTRPTVRNL